LLHRSDTLYRRIRYPSGLGSVIHYFPCLQVAITIGDSETETGRLVYRVIRVSEKPIELLRLPNGSYVDSGSTKITQGVRPLALDMPTETELLIGGGSSDLVRLSAPGCIAPDSTIAITSHRLRWEGEDTSAAISIAKSIALITSSLPARKS
jgi:hypothetical protein